MQILKKMQFGLLVSSAQQLFMSDYSVWKLSSTPVLSMGTPFQMTSLEVVPSLLDASKPTSPMMT